MTTQIHAFTRYCTGSLADIRVRRSRRTNGATQTFRRPPLATNSSQHRDTAQSNSNNPPTSAGVYVPPHLSSNYQSSYARNGASAEGRYSKDQLLEMFKAQTRSGQLGTDVSDLFVDGWNPASVKETVNGGWGRKDEQKDASAGPEICWDNEGKVQPMSLLEMTEEEKEVSSPHCS